MEISLRHGAARHILLTLLLFLIVAPQSNCAVRFSFDFLVKRISANVLEFD